jgi:hypothetical protein
MSADPVFAEELYDPYAQPEDPYGRPERTEDKVPRDNTPSKNPRILPLGMAMPTTAKARDAALRSYLRPSSAGDPLENRFMIERWKRRMVAKGMAMSKTLPLEMAALDEEDKRNQDWIADQAMKLAGAEEKSRRGTATHAITERYDKGMPPKFIPEGFENDLPAWIEKTKDFEILDIECFVVNDIYRYAGTFDRLVYYWEPCPLCGKHNRILDLKTGQSEMGKQGMAVQLAIYAHSAYYDPATGARTPLPDVCLCRGIIVRLVQGSGVATLRWVNIAQAWDEAMPLLERLKSYQQHTNWVADFETRPDFSYEINRANSREELTKVWQKYSALGLWLPQHTKLSESRLQFLTDMKEGI